MPDVGTLNIKIESDAKQAAQGLGDLADALVRVRHAVGTDSLGLDNIRKQINSFSSAIAKTKNTVNVLKTITEFGKAIDRLRKSGSDLNIDPTGSLKKLNDSIGTGVGLKAAASAMNAYAKAVNAVRNAGNGVDVKKIIGNQVNNNKQNSLEESLKKSGYELQSDGSWKFNPENHSSFMPLKSQFFGKRGTRKSEGQLSMDLEGIKQNTVPVLETVESETQKATDKVTTLKKAINDLVDKLNHPENKSYKGFNNVVDAITGVSRNTHNIAEESAKSFDEKFFAPYDAVVNMLNSLNHPGNGWSKTMWGEADFNRYAGIHDTYESPIDPNHSALTIPALDQNGPFKYASEEIEHYTELIEQAKRELQQWQAVFDKTSKQIKYNGDTQERENLLQHAYEGYEEAEKKIEEYKGMLSAVKDYVDKYTDTVKKSTEAINEQADSMKKVAGSGILEYIKTAEQAEKEHFDKILEQNKSASAMATATRAIQEGKDTGVSDGSQEASEHVEGLKEKLLDLKWLLGELADRGHDAFNGLKDGIKKLLKPLTSLLNRFKQIAKYRALRAVLKHITAGFSEGVQNVYHYSKLVGTELAPAMDAAATSLQQMKNSIGAAVAPLIQALIPVLQSVVSWFIDLVNYANQFFAILNGQNSWTRALPESAEAYEKSAKSAKKASKATKDLLADWDELNIIQSQGGNGAGSKSGFTDEEYRNMFEQVYEFDQKVKDAIAFIDEHLGGIPNILKKAGAILLGWKMSSAFKGVLSAIGKLIAGGAMLVLGVELSYGGGFEAGSKGYFDGKDLLASIGGTLATAIGGSVISTGLGLGGGVGLVIGLGVGVISTLVGWIEGQADFADQMKWGNKTMSTDQIKEYVRSKFSFDIESEITILDNNIKDRETAKQNLETEINGFVTSFNLAKVKVGIKADDADTAIKDAYENSQSAFKKFQEYIDTNESLLIKTLKISPITDSKGNDLTEDIIANVDVAGKTLKQYMQDLGRELADAMAEGERLGWEGNTQESVLALMERQRKILDASTEYEREMRFSMEFKQGLSGLTRDNAEKIFEEEQARIEEYKEKFLNDRYSSGEYYRGLVANAQAMIDDALANGKDTTALEASKKVFEDLMNTFLDPEKAMEAWNEKMKDTIPKLREEWIGALTGIYGMTSSEFNESDFLQKIGIGWSSPETNLVDAFIEARKNGTEVEKGTEALKRYFADIMGVQPEWIRSIASEFGFNVWDIATDEIKQSLVDATRFFIGNDDYARQILQNMGISDEEITKYMSHELQDGFHDLQYAFYEFQPPENENITVQAGVDFRLNDDEVEKLLHDKIEEATKDNRLEPIELNNLYFEFGEDVVKRTLEEMSISFDKEGWLTGRLSIPGMGTLNPAAIVAANGMSTDYGKLGGRTFVNGGAEAQNGTPALATESVAGDVAKGTAQGNEAQNSLLEAIAEYCRQLTKKNWTINLNADSGWGRFNARSNDEYDRITGGVHG